MARMLDALKNLEAEESATLHVPAPVVAPQSPEAAQGLPPANAAAVNSLAADARTRTGQSIGSNFMATLASSAAGSAASPAATLPVSATSAQPPAIANAAATLARLKASVSRPGPASSPPPAAAAAPVGLSQPAALGEFSAAVPVVAPVVAAEVIAPETLRDHAAPVPLAPASLMLQGQTLSPDVAPVQATVTEVHLPAPRAAATRLEETVQAALADPRRSVPLEQLARRMRKELRADAGRCWLLADAGEHHDSADLAAHLGAIFAGQLGDVLLIDGSLDCAMLSAGMNVIDRPGLVQVAAAGKAWQNLIQPTTWQHLFLLPAGQIVSGMPDPSAAWTNLLSQAERRFRLVLIDGGPAAVPTCRTLGRLCDATYLVIRLGMTEARQARQAMQQLRAGGARVIGSIATSVPTLG